MNLIDKNMTLLNGLIVGNNSLYYSEILEFSLLSIVKCRNIPVV